MSAKTGYVIASVTCVLSALVALIMIATHDETPYLPAGIPIAVTALAAVGIHLTARQKEKESRQLTRKRTRTI
jgi:hypothetical protein